MWHGGERRESREDVGSAPSVRIPYRVRRTEVRDPFDGHQLRMEFDVMRKDGAAPQDDSRRCVYTASRIVMSAHGVPGLLDQMTRLQAALTLPGGAEPQAAEPAPSRRGARRGWGVEGGAE
ncbi:hypothetical protein [Phenylobacterium sp.]|jgi:hypothetical protein|uniref:hypothetical protein n=1 Tax=Phenylobacterium sp. TaxID=1871053 RepID=UPI002E374C6E|nr:hypothetical protein [Phenylobacterium sp.]HEX4712840.1 hypothetical protein [Phenylobacterium sp.]